MHTSVALVSQLMLQILTSPLLAFSIDHSAQPKETLHSDLQTLSAELDKDQLVETPYIRLTKMPESLSLSAGDDVELTCEAIAVPPPVISWTLNGKPVVTNNDNNVIEKLYNSGLKTIQNGVTSSRILIPCASKKNQGEYKCIATNGQQEVEALANVAIGAIKQPKCVTDKILRPPVINMWTDGRFERSGATAQLFCRTSTNVSTEITWYDEDHNMLSSNGHHQILPNGDLLIHDAQWADMGVYTCVASNTFGEDRVSVFFYPTKPDKGM